ncbi:MAG: chemotaxis protein CheX [Planctomycetota bacterium]|jgi:chemotaxis protein CheX|nr:chemotaxis protein CheX [Planctomycetota bacterium]
MKIIVASPNQTAFGLVKNILVNAKVQNADAAHTTGVEDTLAALSADDKGRDMVLVDWEFPDDQLPTRIVAAVKTKSATTPVLLLCVKAKAGGTFSAMKAGANGVVHKPFEPMALLRAVAEAFKPKEHQSVNVEFINPFIDATRNVLQTMCGVEIVRKKLFLKEDHRMLGEVSGVMGLGGAAMGSVVVSFHTKQACFLVGKMLGAETPTELTPEVCDGVGELINMISGQAKATLAKTKYHFNISIPSVISGAGHEISHRQGTPNIVVLFNIQGETEEFALQVCLAPTGQ